MRIVDEIDHNYSGVIATDLVQENLSLEAALGKP